MTKEAAYYRKIFHQHFPNNNYGNGIEKTVPGGPSVACSTAKAIEWDASFANPDNQDQSGRMVDVHDSTVDVGAARGVALSPQSSAEATFEAPEGSDSAVES